MGNMQTLQVVISNLDTANNSKIFELCYNQVKSILSSGKERLMDCLIGKYFYFVGSALKRILAVS